VLTFLAWELSSAHFNLGITVASLFIHFNKWSAILLSIIALVQLIGVVLGLGLSYAMFLRTYRLENHPPVGVNFNVHQTFPSLVT